MQLTFRQKIPPPLCGSSTKGSHRSSIVGFSALCGRWRYALRGILAYGREEIHVSGGSFVVRISGSGLELRAMTGLELLITGKIEKIQLT